jgi:hypothetical protein
MCRWKLMLLALTCLALGAVVGPRVDAIVDRDAHAGEPPPEAKGFLDLSQFEIRDAQPVDLVEGPSLYYVALDADTARPLLVGVGKVKMHADVRRKGETQWRGATYQQVCMCAASYDKLPTKDDLYFGPKDESAYVGFVPAEWLREWKNDKGAKLPASVREWLDWAEARGHSLPGKYRRKK